MEKKEKQKLNKLSWAILNISEESSVEIRRFLSGGLRVLVKHKDYGYELYASKLGDDHIEFLYNSIVDGLELTPPKKFPEYEHTFSEKAIINSLHKMSPMNMTILYNNEDHIRKTYYVRIITVKHDSEDGIQDEIETMSGEIDILNPIFNFYAHIDYARPDYDHVFIR